MASAEWLRTDGVIAVGEEVRGPIDVPSTATTAPVSWAPATTRGPGTARCASSFYDEERGNGTPLQVNDTDWTADLW